MINFGLKITDIKASELTNLVSNPVVILNNEEENSILLPHRIACFYFPNTVSYITSSSDLIISLYDLLFGKLDPSLLSNNFNASSLINISDCQNVITDDLINQPLLLKNLGQELSGGDGTLKVFVWYSTVIF